MSFLAGDRDAKVRQQAAMALRDICANPRFKTKCAEEGIIDTTKKLLRSDDEVEQTLALAIARHLSIDNDLKRPIVLSGLAKLAIRCAEHSANKPDLQTGRPKESRRPARCFDRNTCSACSSIRDNRRCAERILIFDKAATKRSLCFVSIVLF